MQPNSESITTSLPDKGLPPVQPPTGQMILRLFLVPFVIVAVLVVLYVGGKALHSQLTGAHAPDHYLRKLDNANPDIRWRAASDLSQELPRSAKLQADAPFALELAQRLRSALDESVEAEKDFASKYEGLGAAERDRLLARELAPRRNLIMYLSACLSNFVVPFGAPLLGEQASQTSGVEPGALAERRARALFGLAALGEKLTGFDKLSAQEKDAIETDLEAAQKEGQARFAKPCLEYLQKRRAGKADSFGVAAVLLKCGEDDDPYLRELAAFASNFWTSSAVEQKDIEDMLVRLSTDAGAGEEQLQERLERNPSAQATRPVCKRKGFQVQVNANIALARLGSPRVRLDLLEDMLSLDALREVFVLRHTDGKEEANEALVVVTLDGSLQALAELHRRRPELKLTRFDKLVDGLSKSSNASLRTQATATQAVLKQ